MKVVILTLLAMLSIAGFVSAQLIPSTLGVVDIFIVEDLPYTSALPPACLSSVNTFQTASCTETDAGYDLRNHGINTGAFRNMTNGYNHCITPAQPAIDNCLNTQTLREFVCGENVGNKYSSYAGYVDVTCNVALPNTWCYAGKCQNRVDLRLDSITSAGNGLLAIVISNTEINPSIPVSTRVVTYSAINSVMQTQQIPTPSILGGQSVTLMVPFNVLVPNGMYANVGVDSPMDQQVETNNNNNSAVNQGPF